MSARRPSAASVLGAVLLIVASLVMTLGPTEVATAQVTELQRQLSRTAAERAAATRELAEVRRRADSARDQYNVAQRDYQTALDALARVDDELDRARAELEAAIERAAQTLAELERVTADVAFTEARLEERRVRFETRVVAAFKYGQMSLTDVFTSSRDINDIVVTSTYVNAVVQNDREMLEEMAGLLFGLQEQRALALELRVRADLERDEAVRVESEMTEKYERQQRLTQEVARTRTNLASSLRTLQEDADALQEHLKALEAAQAQIERQLRAAEAAERAGRGVGDTGTGWLKPTDGWLSSGFGMRVHPILQTTRLHAGVDLAAPTGTPVIASRGGTVTFVGWMSGYGQTVIVYHGEGFATLYAHLSAFSVAEGSNIAQGGRLGAVGMTGTATGPHLHFEVRISGVPQNPCGYIPC
jgi:murein DD-endopeptidase MepM/ murein hydrolase activator NlpD